MIVLPDRLAALEAQDEITGIDFVRVVDPCDQTRLWIYFFVDPTLPAIDFGTTPPALETILIVSESGGESVSRVEVVDAVLVVDPVSGRSVLQVDTAEPGDFSKYRLTIDDERVDAFFNGVVFGFKQGCEIEPALDCEPPAKECLPDPEILVDIDYLARDYESFKQVLHEFSKQRHPTWTNGTEADIGTMILELYAALGDELSYIQDQYSYQAHLETATERRSLRQLARLVDYEIHDGRAASTMLDLEIDAPDPGVRQVDAGSRAWANFEDGESFAFEIGLGLHDTRGFDVSDAWNELLPYVYDESQRCLPRGSTEMMISGHPIDDPDTWLTQEGGKWLLLRQNEDVGAGVPERRILVRLVSVDPTAEDALLGNDLTRLIWDEPTPFELDLNHTVVRANVLPATAGQRFVEEFSIGPNGLGLPEAVQRQGPLDATTGQRTPIHLYSMRETETRGLAWLGDDLRSAIPEVVLTEVTTGGEVEWTWVRSILDAQSSDWQFTLDDGIWREIIHFDRIGTRITHEDYAVGTGFTIRFGDGEFGRIPELNADEGNYFRVTYRDGGGARANVARDTIVALEDPSGSGRNMPDFVQAITNPLAVTNGVDPEDPEVIRQLVPEAWRAITHRAVRPEDYAEQAERLPWVQRANGCFRWTGSWLSVFVAPDPLGTFELLPEPRTELEDALDRVRQAGREVIVRDPKFVPIDLEITVCVASTAFVGDVAQRVLRQLTGKAAPQPIVGFFDPDNFSFGTPLRRAALEARIQAVEGVRAVEGMRIRPRGVEKLRPFTELEYRVADNEVIRLENDHSYPERGVLRLVMEGGA
ncbi:baseplate J/gp47 family protein [Paraliomyxa miuraensis]|uniref:hypothetical protein n=1 Tax=Paraliomyxa miuraensis TaxID=376150 RepID=UPI00225800FD|nr:hypothetical protein [Paraliomyxa miuraensis]MCX4247461.1 hypothetical protein [Paraliomyxa miuraensis]